jgi:hypothetical protein
MLPVLRTIRYSHLLGPIIFSVQGLLQPDLYNLCSRLRCNSDPSSTEIFQSSVVLVFHYIGWFPGFQNYSDPVPHEFFITDLFITVYNFTCCFVWAWNSHPLKEKLRLMVLDNEDRENCIMMCCIIYRHSVLLGWSTQEDEVAGTF